MKNKQILIGVAIVAVILALVSGFVVKNMTGSRPTSLESREPEESLEPLDPAIKVALAWSKAKENTVVLSVTGLGNQVKSLAYEFSYESKGLIKGVNSGSKPIDTNGQDSFSREVYLGTCSRNDCKPDLGVSKISVVLEFNNVSGKKSQFSQDFSL